MIKLNYLDNSLLTSKINGMPLISLSIKSGAVSFHKALCEKIDLSESDKVKLAFEDKTSILHLVVYRGNDEKAFKLLLNPKNKKRSLLTLTCRALTRKIADTFQAKENLIRLLVDVTPVSIEPGVFAYRLKRISA